DQSHHGEGTRPRSPADAPSPRRRGDRMMRRRDFITLLGGTAATWPLAAHAQPARQVARIGFLGTEPENALFATSYPVFLTELRKLGFTEGQNLIIEHRRIDEGQATRATGGGVSGPQTDRRAVGTGLGRAVRRRPARGPVHAYRTALA